MQCSAANPFLRGNQGLPYLAAQLCRHLGGTGAANAAGWYSARCPAHVDHRFSLSLKDSARGLIAKCFRGCKPQDIKAALISMAQHGSFDRPLPPMPKAAIADVDLFAIAMRIWQESQPIGGTPAETYLRNRAITIPLPETLRFHSLLYHQEARVSAPAMVAMVQGARGEPVAIHRTWITSDGSGKADLVPVRKSLCPTAGHSVHLGGSDDRIVIAEGVETALSCIQLWGFGGWAALSASGMNNLVVPTTITEIVVCGDADETGRKAAISLRDRLIRENPSRRVTGYFPGNGNGDFNDVLRGKAAAA